jgi:hypothetical protein
LCSEIRWGFIIPKKVEAQILKRQLTGDGIFTFTLLHTYYMGQLRHDWMIQVDARATRGRVNPSEMSRMLS